MSNFNGDGGVFDFPLEKADSAASSPAVPFAGRTRPEHPRGVKHFRSPENVPSGALRVCLPCV